MNQFPSYISTFKMLLLQLLPLPLLLLQLLLLQLLFQLFKGQFPKFRVPYCVCSRLHLSLHHPYQPCCMPPPPSALRNSSFLRYNPPSSLFFLFFSAHHQEDYTSVTVSPAATPGADGRACGGSTSLTFSCDPRRWTAGRCRDGERRVQGRGGMDEG